MSRTLDRASTPFHIAVAPARASYVFNASGQEIDLGGLLCIFDADGPCANAVRDAQRTKTHAGTRATLSVIWGCAGFEDLLAASERWYRALLEETGATGIRAAAFGVAGPVTGMVARMVAMPVAGRLADLFGKQRVLVASVARPRASTAPSPTRSTCSRYATGTDRWCLSARW